MAMRLESENVNYLLKKFMDDINYWEMEGKDAEKQLCYIAGARDMADAVIRAIKELGGK